MEAATSLTLELDKVCIRSRFGILFWGGGKKASAHLDSWSPITSSG